jgi:asparagine synthase (glutamine-hydrolysing)
MAARRRGLRVVLDGVSGDIVLSEGSRLVRLLRAGRWRKAWREANGQNRYWGGNHFPPSRELLRGALTAIVPDTARRWRRRLLGERRERQRVEQSIRDSFINPEFARRVNLADRLRILDGNRPFGLPSNERLERAQAIDHPYLTIGRERYDRVAASVGIEPRDPFLDTRVAAFCLRLPGGQKLDGGWPKAILRRATAGLLPDEVRWRRGKEHLGWSFTEALMEKSKDRVRQAIEENLPLVAPYVDMNATRAACGSCLSEGDMTQAENVYEVAHLGAWLSRHAGRRPQVL